MGHGDTADAIAAHGQLPRSLYIEISDCFIGRAVRDLKGDRLIPETGKVLPVFIGTGRRENAVEG